MVEKLQLFNILIYLRFMNKNIISEPLIDHLRAGLALPGGRAFNSEQVLSIFYQICQSVQYLHNQDPPKLFNIQNKSNKTMRFWKCNYNCLSARRDLVC